MSILEVAKKRYSVKAFDPNKKVTNKEIEILKRIFQLSPSSINIQPWQVLITDNQDIKQKITQATQGIYAFNEKKILDASHIMLLCVKTELGQEHLDKLLEKENADGRIPNQDIYNMTKQIREGFFASFTEKQDEFKKWAENQVYIALGQLLLGAGAMGIDAVPLEGFDKQILTQTFNLTEKGLIPLTLVAFGYHSEEDFNAQLPKSRFDLEDIFSEF